MQLGILSFKIALVFYTVYIILMYGYLCETAICDVDPRCVGPYTKYVELYAVLYLGQSNTHKQV